MASILSLALLTALSFPLSCLAAPALSCAVSSSVCSVEEISPKPEKLHCGSAGALRNAKQYSLGNACSANKVEKCAAICYSNPDCVSFLYTKSTKSCELYSATVNDQNFVGNSRSKSLVYNRRCFSKARCTLPTRTLVSPTSTTPTSTSTTPTSTTPTTTSTTPTVTSSPTPQPVTDFTNGGFETGNLDPWVVFNNYVTYPSTANVYVGSPGRLDNYMLYASCQNGGNLINAHVYFRQMFHVTPGWSWQMSYWYRFSSDTSNDVYLTQNMVNNYADDYLPLHTNGGSDSLSTPLGQWHQVTTGVQRALSDQSYMSWDLSCPTNGHASVVIDDVTITYIPGSYAPLPPPPPPPTGGGGFSSDYGY